MPRFSSVRLEKRWRSFHRSILFYPAVALLLALVAFALTSAIDKRVQGVAQALATGELGFLVFSGGPDAARSVLAAIATIFATIMGVVYSVTLVTVTLSATKYGAQVIPRFEEDKLNRFVLGLFIATVAYSLLVLKTVRVGGDGGPMFAPVLGVNVAILLALASLFFFAWFVANLVTYIRPTRFVNTLAQDTIREDEVQYEPLEQEGVKGLWKKPETPLDAGTREIKADSQGHVAAIAIQRIADTAKRIPEGTVVRLVPKPGALVEPGDVLLRVEAPSNAAIDEKVAKELELAVHLRSRRSVKGDPLYGVDVLGDIGMTTLSGGSTDLGVTGNCIHGLLSVATWEADRDPPPCGFEVHGVKIDLDQKLLTEEALRQLGHLHDRAVKLGYWLLTEKLVGQLGLYLTRLAKDPGRHERYEEALDFVEAVLRSALAGYDDDAATARIVRSVRDVEAQLRAAHRIAKADRLHHGIEEAAAAARRRRERDLGPRTIRALEASAARAG